MRIKNNDLGTTKEFFEEAIHKVRTLAYGVAALGRYPWVPKGDQAIPDAHSDPQELKRFREHVESSMKAGERHIGPVIERMRMMGIYTTRKTALALIAEACEAIAAECRKTISDNPEFEGDLQKFVVRNGRN